MSSTSKIKVAIIDYQLGNLYSVQQACLHLGTEPLVTHSKSEILAADCVILPGVGAFGDAMNNMKSLDLISPVKDFVSSGKPFMGICLGLQLLFTESEEFGSHRGLNIVEGNIKKFPIVDKQRRLLKVPQIEWNQIYIPDGRTWSNTPLENCGNGEYMYFVHSYFVNPASDESILSQTEYGGYRYCSSIYKDNVFACQFHPEKSGSTGIDIYRNWFNKIKTK